MPVTPSSSVFGSLEVSSPSTQPQRDEPPLPELPPPGQVASPPFLPASTPCSRRDLPGVFQPGAPSGFSLQSLTWQRLHAPLDAASLPAIGNGVALPAGDTSRLFHLPGFTSVPRRLSASARDATTGSRVSLPRSPRLRTWGPERPRCKGYPPLPVGSPFPCLHGPTDSRLSWASPSLGHSPSWPWPRRPSPHPSTNEDGSRDDRGIVAPAGRLAPSPGAPPFGLLSGTSGMTPFRVRFPVLQSFKEPGNRLASFEVAGPCEVFILVRRPPRLPGTSVGFGNRLAL
jgi:hypothetical protein